MMSHEMHFSLGDLGLLGEAIDIAIEHYQGFSKSSRTGAVDRDLCARLALHLVRLRSSFPCSGHMIALEPEAFAASLAVVDRPHVGPVAERPRCDAVDAFFAPGRPSRSGQRRG